MFHVKYFTTFATYKQKTNKCMKNLSLKTLALGILALFAVTTISAQEEPAKKKNKFGLANRIGVGVGYGTEGLGFDVAIPLTQYVLKHLPEHQVPRKYCRGVRWRDSACWRADY